MSLTMSTGSLSTTLRSTRVTASLKSSEASKQYSQYLYIQFLSYFLSPFFVMVLFPSQLFAQQVTSVTLVNANNEQDIQTITNNQAIVLSQLPTNSLNIRANISGSVQSVSFQLTGTQTQNAVENVSPYALYGDTSGNYFGNTFVPGNYTLSITPLVGGNPAGPVFTVSFSFVASAPTPTPSATASPSPTVNPSPTVTASPTAQSQPAITGFQLINADTDTVIAPLVNGQVINIQTLPTQNLNIAATGNALTSKITFSLAGALAKSGTENFAPFALYGDISGNYLPQLFPVGNYTLSATPLTASNAPGAPTVISFTVASSQATPTPTATLTASPTPTVILTPTVVPTVTPTVSPTPTLTVFSRIRSGSSNSYVDTNGNTWGGDTSFLAGASTPFSVADPIAGTNDDPLYQFERYGTNFGYEIPVPNGNYIVILHFAELYWDTPGSRIFNIILENDLKLGGFDILSESPKFTPVLKTYTTTVNDGSLSIELEASADNAKISGVEILNGGPGDGGNTSAIKFSQKTIFSAATPGATGFEFPTSLQLGPDGKLYVGTQFGKIFVLTLNAQKEVTNVQVINSIYNTPTLNPNGTLGKLNQRQVTGIFVDPDSSPANPVLYVGHSDSRIGANQNETALLINTTSGVLSKLTGPNFDANKVDLVTGLPRSRENHSINGIQKKDGWLYLSSGGNTNYGAPSTFFSFLPEVNLSASVLRLNLNALPANTINAATGSLEGSQTGAGEIPGVFEVYADGHRNGYDILWHSNGKLYLNDNGGNGGLGGTPGAPAGCPNTPAVFPPDFPDTLAIVAQGSYGGHPNPARGKCVFYNGTIYNPDIAPDSAFTAPIWNYPSNKKSVNGIAEYTANTFNGIMKGNILSAVTYGLNEIFRLELNQDGSQVVKQTLLANSFIAPIDLTVDSASGAIFVAEYGGGKISVLIPQIVTANDFDGDGIPDDIDPDDDNDGYTDADETTNGTDPKNSVIKPADFDNDLTSDLLDSDDDNDGILDLNDNFIFDAFNGNETVFPINFEWNPGDELLGKLKNTGFTGVLPKASVNAFLPDSVSVGAAGGFLSITPNTGDPFGSANTQDNALMIGVNATPNTGAGVFNVHTRLPDPFKNPPISPTAEEGQGIFIGKNQSNFMRLAITGNTGSGQAGIQWSIELGGSPTLNLVAPVPVTLPGPDVIDLYLVVNPEAGSISAVYKIDSGPLITMGTVSTATIPDLSTFFSSGLGTGLMATRKGNPGSSFVAVFDYFRVEAGTPLQIPDTGARALVTVSFSSTYTPGSFKVDNLSTGGQTINRIAFNISKSVLPDILFDPFATAGDPVGKQYTVDANVGGISTTSTQYKSPRDGGYEVLNLVFSSFNQGDSLSFSIDIDPTSIKGVPAPGPQDSGSISGAELTGSLVTVYFSDGTVQTLPLFKVPGNNLNSTAVFAPQGLVKPLLEILNQNTSPSLVTSANQTARVFAPNGSNVFCYVFEGALYTQGVPNNGFDIDEFEANKILDQPAPNPVGMRQYTGTVGVSGQLDLPIVLSKTTQNIGTFEDTGINYVVCALSGTGGVIGPLSDKKIFKFQ
jgi:hypothetical protein